MFLTMKRIPCCVYCLITAKNDYPDLSEESQRRGDVRLVLGFVPNPFAYVPTPSIHPLKPKEHKVLAPLAPRLIIRALRPVFACTHLAPKLHPLLVSDEGCLVSGG